MKKQKAKHANRASLGEFHGHSVTSSIRAMGKAGWTFAEVRAAMAEQGLKPADQTIRIQLSAGRSGKQAPADFDPAQLEAMRPAVQPAQPEADKPAEPEAANPAAS